MTDAWRKSDLPSVCLVSGSHLALVLVFIPFGRNVLPIAFVHHADVYINITLISIKSRFAVGFEGKCYRLVGIRFFWRITEAFRGYIRFGRLGNG